MLLKKNIDDALVQATYMSGDRNAIASALRANERLGVIILADALDMLSGTELRDFYVGVAGARRVEVAAVPRGNAANAKDALRDAYRYVTSRPVKQPLWMSQLLQDRVRVQSATFGTKTIAHAFAANPTAAQAMIARLWRLDAVPVNDYLGNYSDLQGRVHQWLQEKGFKRNRRYVALFAKTGEHNAEKAHHFTSILTWRILQERLGTETSVIPVAAGDDIGLKTTPSLVKFWEEHAWKDIFRGHRIDARAAQLGLWCFLADEYRGLCIVGMRSGILEVPALLGIRTLYLEEAHNQQAERMLKWVGTVPGYERQVVKRPAGIKQQVYWARQSARAPQNSPVAMHARATGVDTRQIAYGFPKATIGHSPSNALRVPGPLPPEIYAMELARAIFGTGGRALAPTITAKQFMLETSEFDSIIRWISGNFAAPVVVHGSVQPEGRLGRQNSLMYDIEIGRNQKSWADHFKTPEYREHLDRLVFPDYP